MQRPPSPLVRDLREQVSPLEQGYHPLPGESVLPDFPVLRVDQNSSATLTLVPHLDINIRSRRSLRDTRDLVVGEFIAKLVVEFDLGSVAEFVRGLLLNLALQVGDLLLEFFALARIIGG